MEFVELTNDSLVDIFLCVDAYTLATLNCVCRNFRCLVRCLPLACPYTTAVETQNIEKVEWCYRLGYPSPTSEAFIFFTEHSSCSFFQEVCRKNSTLMFHYDKYDDSMAFCRRLAKRGNLEMLLFALKFDFRRPRDLVDAAAVSGNLSLVQELAKMKFMITEKTGTIAAMHSHLELCNWFIDTNYCSRKGPMAEAAAVAGQLEILKSCRMRGFCFTTDTFIFALIAQQRSIVEYLLPLVSLSQAVINWAAVMGDLTTLNWLHTKKYHIPAVTSLYAIYGGQLTVLQWMVKKKLYLCNQYQKYALMCNQQEIMKWSCETQVFCTSSGISITTFDPTVQMQKYQKYS
jgi:hypothetical protein